MWMDAAGGPQSDFEPCFFIRQLDHNPPASYDGIEDPPDGFLLQCQLSFTNLGATYCLLAHRTSTTAGRASPSDEASMSDAQKASQSMVSEKPLLQANGSDCGGCALEPAAKIFCSASSPLWTL